MSALTKEVMEYQHELGRLGKAVSQLEKERERLTNDVADQRSTNLRYTTTTFRLHSDLSPKLTN